MRQRGLEPLNLLFRRQTLYPIELLALELVIILRLPLPDQPECDILGRTMAIHYYPLINKIITSLSIRERLSLSQELTSEASFARPFITVAREPGSGGAPIAQKVAEKLSFTFVDDQIIDEIASSTKKRKEVIKAVDEKSRSRIDDMLHSMLNREYMDDLKYVQELVKLVLVYAHKGHAVILGRGANFITPFAQGLHVQITAPYQVRVQRAVDYEGVSEGEAKKIIAKVEAERRDFVKQYLNRDIEKRNSYDLTVNTTYFSVEDASDLIVEAFHRKFTRAHRYRALWSR